MARALVQLQRWPAVAEVSRLVLQMDPGNADANERALALDPAYTQARDDRALITRVKAAARRPPPPR